MILQVISMIWCQYLPGIRYTCPLFSSRKLFRPVKPARFRRCWWDGSRDVCCYFFLGVRQKQKQFALSSFRHESITNLVPGVQKRLEVMAMGHDMPWLVQTKEWISRFFKRVLKLPIHASNFRSSTQIGPSWTIPLIYHGHGSHLPLFGSSLFFLVTFGHIFSTSSMCTVINFDHWCCRRDEDQSCRSLLAQHHLKIWTLRSHFTPTRHILHCSLTQDGFSDFLPFLEMPATQKTHAFMQRVWTGKCKGSAHSSDLLRNPGLTIRSANCYQTNMLCTLKAMRDTS